MAIPDGSIIDAFGEERRELLDTLHAADDIFRNIIDVNLRSSFNCSVEAARAMARHGQGGSIVQIASATGLISMAYGGGYGAAKAALLNLTGLGLGYSYLGRWWRQALHLVVTAGLVVIAFATGAAALPWLWVAITIAWLGWMAVDAWRIARSRHAAPAGAGGHALPVAAP